MNTEHVTETQAAEGAAQFESRPADEVTRIKLFLGIQVATATLLSEGLNLVLDRIQAAGACAIATDGMTLSLPAEPGQGRREPPLDIDGYERILDRPLWGRKELWLASYRTHDPDESLFGDTPYRPGGAPAPADLDRDLVHKLMSGK